MDPIEYIHVYETMELVIPNSGFKDMNERDQTIVRMEFADANVLGQNWIKYNPYVQKISGTPVPDDMSPQRCHNLTINETYKLMKLNNGSYYWAQQKLCIYQIRLVISDSFTEIQYNFQI